MQAEKKKKKEDLGYSEEELQELGIFLKKTEYESKEKHNE